MHKFWLLITLSLELTQNLDGILKRNKVCSIDYMKGLKNRIACGRYNRFVIGKTIKQQWNEIDELEIGIKAYHEQHKITFKLFLSFMYLPNIDD